MATIQLDSDLRSKLNGLNEPLEVRDEHNRIVGQFLPQAVYEDLFYGALAAESGLSKEELRAMHRQKEGKPLAEFWRTQGQQ